MNFIAVNYTEASKYKSKAAKEGSSITNTNNTTWLMNKNKTACLGIIFLASGGCRIKGVFVDKEVRGQGIGNAITNFAILYARNGSRSYIEALAYNYNYYINSLKFKKVGKQRPNGAQMVRRVL